jgi:acyl carrier protein
MSADVVTVVDQAWEEALGVLGSADSDFFELGGHSLLAMQMMDRLHQALGLRVPLRLIFEEPRRGPFGERVRAFVKDEGVAA